MRYRTNTAATLRRLLAAAEFSGVVLTHNADPSYIAFNRPLLELSFAIERLLARPALRAARVHILGVAVR